MKKTLLTLVLGLSATVSIAQVNYDVRWANQPDTAKHYDTDRLQKAFTIEKVFEAGEVNWLDRMYVSF